jgi:hypothetical protein
MGIWGNGQALALRLAANSRGALAFTAVIATVAFNSPVHADPALESRTPPPSSPERGTAGSSLRTQFLAEGFETAIPPAGWRVANAASVSGVNRWHRTTTGGFLHPDHFRSGDGARGGRSLDGRCDRLARAHACVRSPARRNAGCGLGRTR